MTGPFTLLRKKSQKLKRKLSKHEKKSDDTGRPHHHGSRSSHYGNDTLDQDYNGYSPIGSSSPIYATSPRNAHSVSFDLSPAEYNDLSFDIPYYDSGHSRSIQNLHAYGNNKENLLYKSDVSRSRRSLDNLGTLIKIPKRGSSPPSALTNPANPNPASNRISFDIASFQLNKSKLKSNKRVISDSSLYSNSRPTSMILDSDTTFIPPYSIHGNSNSNIGNSYGNKIANGNIYGSIYPNRLSKSTLSLSTAVDSEYLTMDNDIKRSSSVLRAKSPSHSSRHTHHSHHKHDHPSRKKSLKRAGNNQGIVLADIDRWSSETSSNIIFAIIFHILNIFFSVCIYLPIYILVRLGYVSFLLIGLAVVAWYVYGGSPSTAVVVNLQHTISEI